MSDKTSMPCLLADDNYKTTLIERYVLTSEMLKCEKYVHLRIDAIFTLLNKHTTIELMMMVMMIKMKNISWEDGSLCLIVCLCIWECVPDSWYILGGA